MDQKGKKEGAAEGETPETGAQQGADMVPGAAAHVVTSDTPEAKREEAMALEYEGAAHIRTAIGLSKAAARLYATKKVVAARELAHDIVNEIVAYDECMQGVAEIGKQGVLGLE